MNELIKDIEKFENEETLVEMFEEYIRDCSIVNICGIEIDAAKALKEFDPVAYRTMFNDFIDTLER